MKKLYTVLIFTISMLLVGNMANAQLLNLWIDGDRVVYDVPNGKYFNPNLPYFFNKTYDQQDAMISDLVYANIDDWRWALYKDMMDLRLTMFGFLVPDDFNMAYGKNINRFFMWTDEMHVPIPGYVTHGRTGDEDGLETGAKISALVNPVIPATLLAPRYVDYGTKVYPGITDPNDPLYKLYYTLPRGDYNAPYYGNKGSEAQDHWFLRDESQGWYMFNDDLNYTDEDKPYAWQDTRTPKEDYYHPCGAWVVYDGPEIAEMGELDIRPYMDRNLVYPDSRWYLPVAILTTDDLDAKRIKRQSIRIGPEGGKIKVRRKIMRDVDRDGDRDLILWFKIEDTGIHEGDEAWGFYAETYQGVGYVFMDEIETYSFDNLKSAPAEEDLLALDLTVDVYPNPFTEVTNIRIHLSEAGPVMLKLYNSLGQEINVLADRHFEDGTHTLLWDGTDMSGSLLPSGIYIYRIQAGEEVSAGRIQLIR
jgi:hypothetical protein